MSRLIYSIGFFFLVVSSLNAQNTPPVTSVIGVRCFSNPSGYDYLTHWLYNDSNAVLSLHQGVLHINTNVAGWGKPKHHPLPDSLGVSIQFTIDTTLLKNKGTDKYGHDLSGILIYKNITYPIYGSWAFSAFNTPHNPALYLNLTIGHKNEVLIPFTPDQLKGIVLTDFTFEIVHAFIN
jgi:hypothetical protein